MDLVRRLRSHQPSRCSITSRLPAERSAVRGTFALGPAAPASSDIRADTGHQRSRSPVGAQVRRVTALTPVHHPIRALHRRAQSYRWVVVTYPSPSPHREVRTAAVTPPHSHLLSPTRS